MAASVRGMRLALARIRLLPRTVNQVREDALREWAGEIEKSAKELAPVRTGKLRDSIGSRVNTRAGKAWIEIQPGKTREYAYYVEKGTSKMADQPFLGPAAQLHRRTGERAVLDAGRRRFRW